MESLFAKVKEAIPKGIEHARAEVIGIINPNRRHDQPEEIAEDELRAQINAGHRFKSFAGERTNNDVKWHIDGHDYMWALSEMLENAQEVIFILDWWLTPELYLRRPAAHYPEWRLDRILKRKAEKGVKSECADPNLGYANDVDEFGPYQAHSRRPTPQHQMYAPPRPYRRKRQRAILVAPRKSIADIIRLPRTWHVMLMVLQVVVVDNHYAAIGGLDLCFGRWDTHTHPLADVHPTDFSRTLFPGQDYNNARVMDFKEVYNYASNTLSILDTGRMPWHDVHMTLVGPAVLDIVQHFVERWNEIKKRKYRNDNEFVWLGLPHDVDAAPNEPVARHPHLHRWRAIGHKYKQRWHGMTEGIDRDRGFYQPRPKNCKVQVVRSVSDWSHGVLPETSIQNAYIQLIEEAKYYIYIENQFFISATKSGEQVKNLIAQALVQRILRAAHEGAKFKVVVCLPEVPGFAGDVKTESSLKIIMAAQYRTMNRGGSSIYEQIRNHGYDPKDYIRFYHLRSYDRINAPMASYISKIEQNSGVTFHEAQVALARQWIGQDPQSTQKEVTLTLPSVTGEGIVVSGKTAARTVTVPIPESEELARATVARFERGADGLRGDEPVSDTVAQHMLSDRTSLLQEKWLGTPEEEHNA
ncbi:hypothetical protein H0H81_000948 [Sphagnurus paluster]|uniref:Phospholipase D n=1 Tax=Sphagnurus paluster TaxID=117069 RepID=A0A9P7GMI7_9AGAR|nr:hypothetical protein H0H81_000948 [Sphagnurus paluster]